MTVPTGWIPALVSSEELPRMAPDSGTHQLRDVFRTKALLPVRRKGAAAEMHFGE